MHRATLHVSTAMLLAVIGSASLFESLCWGQDHAAPTDADSAKSSPNVRERLAEERRQFQTQLLITAKPYTWIVNPADPPRIVWRDV
jgi:hypothetical protein